MLKVRLSRFVKDDASLQGKEEGERALFVSILQEEKRGESAVSILSVSQSPYLRQLVILLVKLGKINPECVRLPNCLINIHRLDSLCVCVDDLGERRNEGVGG